ncbi:MAG: 3'(2'),5'-bisphosphate nucleotidase CysQ [Alphaproteobacteria bacterium]
MPAGATTGGRLSDDHALLVAAVRAAGARALADFGRDVEHWEKRPGQPVSAADIAVDRLLEDRLRGARPDYGWLSEEGVDDGARLAVRRLWIVDPIDGTRAFLAGLPEFSVSAALVEDGVPLAGAVFNPATGELFEAFRGGGTRCNGANLRVSARAGIRGARLVLSRTEMRRAGWQRALAGARTDAISSTAYKLALVAAGRFDATATLWPKHEWDAAAGDVIVREAGGRVSDAAGAALVYNRPQPRIASLVAAGPRLHARLCAHFAAPRSGR